jgi:uncharacterized membrane protein
MGIFDFIYQILYNVYANFEFAITGIIVSYGILLGLFRQYPISVEGIRVVSQNYIIIFTAFLATTFVVISFNHPLIKEIMQNYALVVLVTISCCIFGIFASIMTLIYSYTSEFSDNNLTNMFYLATFATMIPLWSIVRIIVIYLTEISHT